MLATAGAGDGQPIRCDSAGVQQASGDDACVFNDNQHRSAVVERPSSCTATSASPRYKSHLQRDPDRSYFLTAGGKGEAQTAKSASPRCNVHLQRNLRMRPELSARQACAFRMEHLLAGNDVY